MLAFSGASYIDVLVGKGALNMSQVDESYTGDPSRFVAADGNIVSQGFVTAEPYLYENEVPDWKKPVKFLLLDNDVPIYQDDMAIRTDKLDANRACLQKLVPLMQQSADRLREEPGPDQRHDRRLHRARQRRHPDFRHGRPPTRCRRC